MKTISFLLAAFLSVNAWADSPAIIVDVRSNKEYQAGHIEGALHYISHTVSRLLLFKPVSDYSRSSPKF